MCGFVRVLEIPQQNRTEFRKLLSSQTKMKLSEELIKDLSEEAITKARSLTMWSFAKTTTRCPSSDNLSGKKCQRQVEDRFCYSIEGKSKAY